MDGEVQEKVDVQFNQRGNAEAALERTVSLLDKAVAAEAKLSAQSDRASASLERQTRIVPKVNTSAASPRPVGEIVADRRTQIAPPAAETAARTPTADAAIKPPSVLQASLIEIKANTVNVGGGSAPTAPTVPGTVGKPAKPESASDDPSLYSKREQQERKTKDAFKKDVETFGQSGAETRQKMRVTAQAKDRATTAMPKVAGMLGEGAASGLMKLAGPVGIAVGAFKALQGAMDIATSAITTFSDPLLTSAQKMNKFTEGLPLVGGFLKSIREFGEALDGTAERVAKAFYNMDRQKVALEARDQSKRETSEAAYQLRQAQAVQKANRFGAEYVADKTFDKTTVAGDIRSEESDKRLAAQDNITKATRGVQAAAQAKADQEGVSDYEFRQQARKKIAANQATAKRKAYGEVEENTGQRRKANIAESLADENVKLLELQKQQVRYQEEETKNKEKALELARAESDLRKANIEASKVELDILKAKEQRMTQAQQRLGSLNQGEYQMAREAAKLVKEQGIEKATPEMIEAANKIAPRMIQKMQENLGAERAKEVQGELAGVKGDKGIDDEFQADFANTTVKEVRARIDQVKADVRVDINLDEQKLADATARSLDRFMQLLIKTLEVREKTIKELDEVGQRLRKSQEG